MGASTNAMEISKEVERAQQSLMVHVALASEVIGEMEDLARKTDSFLTILLLENLHLKGTDCTLTSRKG